MNIVKSFAASLLTASLAKTFYETEEQRIEASKHSWLYYFKAHYKQARSIKL